MLTPLKQASDVWLDFGRPHLNMCWRNRAHWVKPNITIARIHLELIILRPRKVKGSCFRAGQRQRPSPADAATCRGPREQGAPWPSRFVADALAPTQTPPRPASQGCFKKPAPLPSTCIKIASLAALASLKKTKPSHPRACAIQRQLQLGLRQTRPWDETDHESVFT